MKPWALADLRRRLDLGVGHPVDVGRSVGDVLAHRGDKQHALLEDDGDLAAHRRHREVAQVVAVDQNTSVGRVPETKEQRHQRGLARAGRSDDTHSLSRPDREIDPVQGRPVRCRTRR